MSRTADSSNYPQKGKYFAQELQEVSDTETIDYERPIQDTEVSEKETIDHETIDLDNPRSACQSVFDTTELLEHIISFLPMKKIFTIQRVSKQWRDVIATSPSIEEKMFLRLKTTPKETCDPHEVDWLNRVLQRHGRPVPSTFTLVSLNPELKHDAVCSMRHLGLTCARHGTRVMAQWGPTPIKQCHSLFDAYISDPPCKNAEVCLTVRFKKEEVRGIPNSDAEYPIKLLVSNITARSDSGLTFQDVFRAALNTRAGIECKDDFNFPSKFDHPSKSDAFRYKMFSWPPDDSLRETIGLPEYTETPEVLDCVLMELKMTLLDDVAVPTPQELVELRRGGSARQQ